MGIQDRREFLGSLAAAIALPAFARAAAPGLPPGFPGGLAGLPGGEVFEEADSGGFVVYEARSLKPLHAGARAWSLPPRADTASVAKTFCAHAALRTGVLAPEETLLCDGDGFKPDGHGPIAVVEALAVSCNTFFEKSGARLTWESFRDSCRALGGLEERLPSRPPGLLQRLDVYAHGAGLSTGFEELARLARAVAFGDPEDAPLTAVRRGWREAVTRGTARDADVEGLEVAGKTGSLGSAPWERKFAAFAPLPDPRWIVTVRTAGEDGASPARIAGRVFRALQSLQRDPRAF